MVGAWVAAAWALEPSEGGQWPQDPDTLREPCSEPFSTPDRRAAHGRYRIVVERVHADDRELELIHLAEQLPPTEPPVGDPMTWGGTVRRPAGWVEGDPVWWSGTFDGTLMPVTVTGEAVAYFADLAERYRAHHGRGDGPRMDRVRFAYRAAVTRDGDDSVVQLSLSWWQHCGRLCALWFDVDRTVTFDSQGRVIDDVTTRGPMAISAAAPRGDRPLRGS